MVMKALNTLAGFKNYLSFWLTLVSLIGLFALGFSKDVDVTSTVPIVLAIFIGSKATEKMTAIRTAGAAEDCDTHEAIKTVMDKS